MAQIVHEMRFKVDVKNGLTEQPQRAYLMKGDENANRVIVQMIDGNQDVDITGALVKATMTLPGKSVDLDGEAQGNEASVLLDENCYTESGRYKLRMSVTIGGTTRTVLFISGYIEDDGSVDAESDSSGSGEVKLQSKSVTPSETAQTVRPDGGYDGLSSVAVGAISKTYVGSSVPRKAAATITPGTSAQTIAAGQYLSGAQMIAGDSDLIPANIRSGVNIFGVTGAYTASGGTTEPVLQSKAVVPTADGFIVTADSGYDGLSQVTVGGDDDLIPANIRSGVNIFGVTGTYTASGGTAEPVLQEKTVTPTASGASITPDAGYDGLSAVYMKGDSDLVAQNIKSGVNIFGVTGTYTGSGSVGLPSGISALASGTFTPESDITSYHVVEHGLGVAPNFTYVMLMDALDEAIPNMLISMFEYGKSGLPKKMEYGQIVYYDSSGALIQSGTQAAIFDANSIYINATSSRALKAGYTYRWVAGVMDGIA